MTTPPPIASRPQPGTADILARLITLLGEERVETREEKRIFFATDMDRSGGQPIAIVRPADSATLADTVRFLSESGVAMVPRGGGFSYTGGYVPDEAGSVIVDLRGLDRVVSIDAIDMVVIAEVGCTWHTLYEALKEKGLRTPYFGPMSGYHATIGGALSQGSFFLGSSQYGPVAESVLAVEVVLANGDILRTGSWGTEPHGHPFYRSYGPDLTGLFLGDTGALGFKTKAALKLIPFPSHQAFASFAFGDEQEAIAAVSAISRTGIAAECYCWDPYFVEVMAGATAGLAEELKLLAGVARGGGTLGRGLMNAARVAFAGKRIFDQSIFMLNLTTDDISAAGADARIAMLRKLAKECGGREIAATAPAAMRGTPFIEFNTQERRRPLRNLPTHGLVPHSRLPALSRDVRAVLDRHGEALMAHGVECGAIYFGVGAQTVCMEPIFYWEDPRHFGHDRVSERSDLATIAILPPDAGQIVTTVRKDLIATFAQHGAAHVQIGRAYPWLQTRSAPARALVNALKTAVDPARCVNPGSLGL